jgi:hypothetical protein
MVHGTNYGVQYIIKLNKEIDLYDDLLPICSHVRTMLKILPDQKICILHYNTLDKRFRENEESKKLISSLFSEYSSIRERNDTNKDLFIYLDVYNYSKFVKDKKNLTPLSKQEILNIESMYKKLLDSEIYLKEIDDEIIRLKDLLKIQYIISDNEYYQKIIEIEKNITNIQLTKEEELLIDIVIKHPKLEGLIEYSHFELMSESY